MGLPWLLRAVHPARPHMKSKAIAFWLPALAVAGLPSLPTFSPAAQAGGKLPMLPFSSPAFTNGAAIPAKYSCDGKNVSPPLKWSGVPSGTKSLALLVEDPDAPSGLWVHWVLFALPPTTTELPEDVAKSQYLPGGARQGLNDFRHLGYGGPCPPSGKPHRYFFKLYALDAPSELQPGATRKELLQAMERHVLAEGELMGTYKR